MTDLRTFRMLEPTTLWPMRPIVIAAIAAVAGAIVPQWFGVLGVAVASAPMILAACRQRGLGAWCLAVPASLAAYTPSRIPATPPPAGPVVVDGQVTSRLLIDDLRGGARCVVTRGRSSVLCVFAHGTRLRPGDTVRAVGRLTPRVSGRDGTIAVVAVPSGGLLEVKASRSLATTTESLRLTLHAALIDAVPGRAGRVLAQLVLGHGGDVDVDIADAHRATGLSHLLAVSGAHVSLLAAMLSAFAYGSRRRARPPWAVLVAVLVYGTITGLDPPVVRALIAFALLLAARRSGRRFPAVAALAAPGILTALVQPSDTTTASFALSYAAVAGLALTPLPQQPCTRLRAVGSMFLASAWATLATAPITLHMFGQVAPWTILATPILSPLVALMLALGLVLAGLGALDVAAPWLALPLRLMAEVYMGSVAALAGLPGAPILAHCQPPPLFFACSAIVGALAVMARPDRWGVAGLCSAFVLVFFVPWPASGPPRLALLDVGHGQACLLHLPSGHTALVDCGSQGNARRAADAVARALAPRRRIDLLVLTHKDDDHTGGVLPLLRRVRVGAVVLPSELSTSALAQAVRRTGVRVTPLSPGAARELLPGLRISRPAAVASERSNDVGLWARADLGNLAILLPGDAEAAGVRAWLASPHVAPADVLVLPHHGRRHGAIAPLLESVAPRLALVSGGEPDEAAPEALTTTRLGIRVLETAHVGDIVVHATAPPRVHLHRPEPVLLPTK